MTSSAQNLIKNSEFEEYLTCPTREDQLSFLKDWRNPNSASPDYYNNCGGDSICNKTIVGVPYNFNGMKKAHSGNGYVGIVLWSSDSKYKEYVQTKLKSKLVNGKQYKYSFWLSLADSSNYITNGISICLSSDFKLSTGNPDDGGIVRSSQGKSLWCEFPLYKSTEWIQITGIYNATGNEEYLTIGIFKDDDKKVKTKKIKKGKKHQGLYAYYYIDDVDVVLINNN